MTAKKKPTIKPANKPKHVVEVPTLKDDNFDDAVALTLTRPEVHAAVTIQQWESLHDVNALAKTLSLQIDDVNNGNMKRPEAMLLAQAHTLDQLFNTLAQRAHRRETVSSCETHLRLAFKAQNQCRTTLETLSNIKNPPVIFAKQANISNGHQQINNGTPAPATHAEEIKNQPNELLEAQHGGTTLDTGTTSATIGKDKAMAALE
jgi:hypothetical protein